MATKTTCKRGGGAGQQERELDSGHRPTLPSKDLDFDGEDQNLSCGSTSVLYDFGAGVWGSPEELPPGFVRSTIKVKASA